jgi:hypothetical protein
MLRIKLREKLGIAVMVIGMLTLGTYAFGATVTMESGTINPGYELANLAITLTLEPGDEVASGQWDLTFDISSLNLYAVQTGPAAEAAGKTVSFSELNEGTIRILVTGLNMDAVPDGVLARVLFAADSRTVEGESPLTLNNAILSNPYGTEVSSSAVSGVLTLTPVPMPTGLNNVFSFCLLCLVLLFPGILYLETGKRGKRRCLPRE